MNVIKQPNFIIFGKNSIDEFHFPSRCLVITSKGAKSRGWLDRFKLKNYYIFDKVEPNPSIEIIDEIWDCKFVLSKGFNPPVFVALAPSNPAPSA